MLAIDTNVIVRYLTGDHPIQSARAKSLIEREHVFVCTTVLLETEWVLRSIHDYSSQQIINALRAFAGLPTVEVEAPAATATALDWAERGMDFADALHLAKATGCEAFVSFDRKFAELANRLAAGKRGRVTVRLP
jgi:predicted nucleic acid-binding protein